MNEEINIRVCASRTGTRREIQYCGGEFVVRTHSEDRGGGGGRREEEEQEEDEEEVGGGGGGGRG